MFASADRTLLVPVLLPEHAMRKLREDEDEEESRK